MKVKITDLMDLYEDKNCPLKPTAEQKTRAAQDRPRGENTEEAYEVKQSKYPFGWRQALSLAAALALLVLGGFGVKRLMDRGGLQLGQTGAPGQTGASEQIPRDTNDVVWLGWEPISGEEQEPLSRFLTCFAQQGVESMEDLDEDAELIRFAFIYRRIYDPESIPVQRNDDGELWDTLSPEQVNETLTKLLGKTVTPREGADYSLLRSDPVGGRCGFHDGYYWQEPSGEDHLLRFSLATDALNSRDSGRLEVMFTTYEVRLLYWGNGDLYPLPGLSTEEAEALVQEGKLKALGTSVAEILETGDGYRLLGLTLQSTDPEPSDPETTEPASEETPEELHTEPTGFDSVSAEDWERFNGLLTNAARYGFPKIDENGDLASTDVEFPNCFALASALTGWDDDSCEVSFEAYEADPERWPEFLSLNPALIENPGELIEAGKIRVVGSGTATFRRVNGALLLTGCSVSSLQTKPALGPEDPALKAELQALFSDPGSWYARALSSSYARPEDVDLYLFFYDGLPGGDRLSNEELRELYSEDAFDEDGDFMGPPTDRMARAEMDKVLKQIFGLGLEDSSKRGLDGFGYLEESDCYYHCHGDTNMEERRITAARRQSDGTVLVTYEDGFWNDLTDGCYPALHTAALRPDGAGNYLVVSNLPGEWVTAEDLGELSALFPLSGILRAETRDADGTVTVRELDFGMDGEFHYREGDPNSEFSHWTWGKWWIGEDRSFRCALCETSESGNRFSPWRSVSFSCTYQNGELVLTQQSETGFAEDAPGTELRFAPTAE